MALSDKNIVITPNIGSASDPKIVFSGADGSTAAQNITLQVYPTNSGTLSFEGSSGQLFSITNSMSGTIFSANDVSGIPSIEVLDTGVVKLAQYNGLVGIGTADFSYITGDNSPLVGSFTNNKLYVNGSIQLLGNNDSISFGRGTGTFIKDEEIGFGWGSGWYMVDGSYLRVRNNISVYTTGDVRASIFYDSNDTGYYVNPNGGSYISSLQTAGGITLGSTLTITNTDIRSNASSTWTGDPGAQGKIQYHSNRWYIVADESSNRIVQFRRNGSDLSYIDNSGVYQGASTSCTGNAASATYAGYVTGNNTSVVGKLAFYGNGGNSGQGWDAYGLYQESGSWSNPFPDLAIHYHTGIKISSYYGYNGTRFYNNSGASNDVLLASIGDGDYNFRSYYNIIAYASDKRLKENVINIDNALHKVMQLNGVTFDWKKEVEDLGFSPTSWHECGVLAQEVEAVLPEAVEIAPFDYDWKAEDGSHSKSGQKYLTVKYEKIVPLLIEAMKEQQSQIQAQQDQINQLMNLVKEMKNGI